MRHFTSARGLATLILNNGLEEIGWRGTLDSGHRCAASLFPNAIERIEYKAF
jgi:hypothetical protein